MNKQDLIQEGIELLNQHEFPVELLGRIKEKRLRIEVLKGIMTDGKHYSTLTDTEKAYRRKRLKLELAASDYLDSKDRFVPTAIAFILLGLITLISAIIGLNSNFIFGISALLQGIVVLVIGLSFESYSRFLPVLSLVFGVLIPLEIIIVGFPQEFLPTTYENRGVVYQFVGLISLVIDATPFIYLLLRVSFWYSIFQFYLSDQKLMRAKDEFWLTVH